MSKCREKFIALYRAPESQLDFDREFMTPFHSVWLGWKAAWNIRGKVDAEAIQEVRRNDGDGQSTYWYSGIDACAEAIEKEQCK